MSAGGCRCTARSMPTTSAISRPRRRALDPCSIIHWARLPSPAGLRATLDIDARRKGTGFGLRHCVDRVVRPRHLEAGDEACREARLLLDGDGGPNELSRFV